MEISNKTFGIFCVAVVCVTVYVRAQSIDSKQKSVASPPVVTQTVAEKPKRRRGIPNSTLPPDPNAQIDTQPAADDSPVTVEAVPDNPQVSTLPITPQTSDTPITPNSEQDDLTYQDDLGDLTDPIAADETPPANNGWPLSDRDTLRLMMRTMPEEQRDEFRVMWFSLTPDERSDVLDQIRGSQ